MVFAIFLLGDGTPMVQKPEELYVLERYFSLAEGPVELERRYRWTLPRIEQGRLDVVATEVGIDLDKMLAEDGVFIDLAGLIDGFVAAGRDAQAGPYPLRIDLELLTELEDLTRHQIAHAVVDGWMVVTLRVVAELAGAGTAVSSPYT